MKTNCPYCSREIDLEDVFMDADLLAIIKIQPSFGKNASLIWAYCELFGIRPLSTRRKKLRLLLEEMKRLFDAGEFTYQKRRYKITEAGIVEALNVMVHRHWDAHLENHNYLKKIMIGIAEASAKADRKQADKDLHKMEERLRNPYCEYPYQDEQVEPPTRVIHGREDRGHEPEVREASGGGITPEQIEANKKRLRELAEKMG